MMEPKFAFPPSVLAAHVALLGKTGSGKTSTGKLLIEQVVDDGARVCILDPSSRIGGASSRAPTARSPACRSRSSAGRTATSRFTPAPARRVGELVGRGALPLSIIDMADFEAGGLQKFFVDFAPTLLRI
jgi:DNA helicase HerA-like ATPase